MIAARKIVRPAYADLPVEVVIGGVRVTRLYPPQDFLERMQTEAWRGSNNNSIVLKAALDGVSILFAGDIMQMAEKELVHLAQHRLASTVLFVPHHGSKSSSSVPFVKAVDPDIAAISAGRNNRFRFPSKTVLKRLEAIDCRIYRTDLDGAIMFSTRGGKLEVETPVKAVD